MEVHESGRRGVQSSASGFERGHVYKPALVSEVQAELPSRAFGDGCSEEVTAQARERLEAELRRLTAIVQNSNDAVIIQTMEGEILAWNRGAELMYGYGAGEAVGMSARMLVPSDQHWELEQFAERFASGEGVESVETRRLTKDGRVINVWLSVTALVDGSGGLEAIATTERDITPVKRAEETIRIQQSELAHMSRVHAMGEFAAAMAHELNQPLCAIGANARAAQRMLEGGASREEVSSALSDIMADVERSSGVVKGLRDQLRRCDPEYSSLDINEVMVGIAPIAEVLGRCEQASVLFELAEGVGRVMGDRVQLQQVLLNLVRNGLESMAESGGSRRELRVSTAAEGEGAVLVSVRDWGVGLSVEVAERMFEPFFTTKREGMGMGLAICSSIVAAHGGRMWASGHEEAGCTVSFSLPCIREGVA